MNNNKFKNFLLLVLHKTKIPRINKYLNKAININVPLRKLYLFIYLFANTRKLGGCYGRIVTKKVNIAIHGIITNQGTTKVTQ